MNTEIKQQVEERTFFRNGHPDYTFEVLDGSGNTICSGVKNRETVVRIANLPVLEAENKQLKDINRELVEALETIVLNYAYTRNEGVTTITVPNNVHIEASHLIARARTAGERIEE